MCIRDRYYLVERATGLVLPIDGNGKLYVTGKYPLLNKKLERTGKYSSLATKGGEYTDYSYKNQYSAVAESRKLDGSKAWDGFYLSYAKGCNGVQREHNKKLNNGLPILHKVPPKRDYGRYFCIMAEKGGTSHGGLTEKLSLFFHAKKQEVNAYGR